MYSDEASWGEDWVQGSPICLNRDFVVAPLLFIVELRKAGGDTLEFHKIKREISTMKLIRHPNVILMYEDPNCFDSSIWNDISLLEEIDFTAIQLEATSKVLYPDVDEQAMKIEPHSQIQMKCADLNLDGDEGKNLID
ncbi:hypothetical protein LguiA_001760 [Lonicera macranthoides]